MAFYLQIPGIRGAVTDSQHKDWIGIHDINFHSVNNASVKPGHVSDRITGVPVISNFVLTKLTDMASPKILEASLSGKVFDKVVIHICNSDAKPFVEYTLHKAIISHYDMNAENTKNISHTHLQEALSINATKIEMRYMASGTTPISTAYDPEQIAFG